MGSYMNTNLESGLKIRVRINISHANGLCQLADGTSYYFEYNGTCDVCCTRLYRDVEQLNINWRKDNKRKCNCHPNEKLLKEAILSTDYAGWHFLWMTTICDKCMSITGKIMEDL